MAILEKLRKFDNFWVGVVFGIGLPALLYPILRPLDPENFIYITTAAHISMVKLLPMLLSRCIFPNALLFFIFIWTNFERVAKGILYTTMFLVGALFIIQYFF